MKSVVMSKFTYTWLPSVALILFLSVFIIMMVYIWRKSSAEIYKEISDLPMNEGNKYE